MVIPPHPPPVALHTLLWRPQLVSAVRFDGNENYSVRKSCWTAESKLLLAHGPNIINCIFRRIVVLLLLPLGPQVGTALLARPLLLLPFVVPLHFLDENVLPVCLFVADGGGGGASVCPSVESFQNYNNSLVLFLFLFFGPKQ